MNKANGFIKEDPGKSGEICILINAAYYFINSVFIFNNNGRYQLVGEHNGRLLIDKPYNTLRGAKIAFSKLFGHRGWQEDTPAEWSCFYEPDGRWLDLKKKDLKAIAS